MRSGVTHLSSMHNLPFSIELLAEAHRDTLDTLHKDIPNGVPDCRLKRKGVQMCPVSHCDDVWWHQVPYPLEPGGEVLILRCQEIDA